MLPSQTNCQRAWSTSQQDLYSRALNKCSVVHWPHWHLQNVQGEKNSQAKTLRSVDNITLQSVVYFKTNSSTGISTSNLARRIAGESPSWSSSSSSSSSLEWAQGSSWYGSTKLEETIYTESESLETSWMYSDSENDKWSSVTDIFTKYKDRSKCRGSTKSSSANSM